MMLERTDSQVADRLDAGQDGPGGQQSRTARVERITGGQEQERLFPSCPFFEWLVCAKVPVSLDEEEKEKGELRALCPGNEPVRSG